MNTDIPAPDQPIPIEVTACPKDITIPLTEVKMLIEWATRCLLLASDIEQGENSDDGTRMWRSDMRSAASEIEGRLYCIIDLLDAHV
jgi:hypothetical protein